MSVAHIERPAKLIPFSTRRSRGQVETVVFWERMDGDLMLAPHTAMKPFLGYRKVECSTIADIDRMSRRMATQEENKLRGLKVEEMLRSLPRWEQIISNCKLRLAAGCISRNDEALTRSTLANMERKKAKLIEIMMGTTSVAESSLVIETKEAPIGMAQYAAKKVVVE
jgi:hypothetical protein